MELAVNGIRLLGKRHGVGRYIEYLLRCWATQPHPFERIRVYTPRPVDAAIPFGGRVTQHVLPTTGSPAYWEQVVLPRRRRTEDLLFCPSYVAPLAARGKVVVTHLGSYEAIPAAFPWRERLKARWAYQLSARKATRLITVSASSRRDIIRFYGVAPEKIRVIPLGVSPEFRPLNDPERAARARVRYFGRERPFLLFVGKLSARRNIPQLIAAFGRLKAKRQTCHALLLIGQNSTGLDIARLARESGVADSVLHLDYADHAELVEAYNAADLFIYPSSYEGFGIPVLEAMACGAPTIALRNSAFTEFAADGAYLAPDGSVDALGAAMDAVLSSAELRDRLRRDGVAQAKPFGWEGIARQTMTVLAAVAQQ